MTPTFNLPAMLFYAPAMIISALEIVTSIGFDTSAYGPPSMRRTKVTQFYKNSGNLREVQLLHGHTKMDGTVRHFGVEHEDALAIAVYFPDMCREYEIRGKWR